MEEYSRPAALAPLGWPNAAKGAAGHRTASTGHSSLLEIALTTQVCYNAALLGMQLSQGNSSSVENVHMHTLQSTCRSINKEEADVIPLLHMRCRKVQCSQFRHVRAGSQD